MKKNKMILKRILACGLCLTMLAGCTGKKKEVNNAPTENVNPVEEKKDITGKKNSGKSGNTTDFITGIKAKYEDGETVEYDEALYNLEKDHVFVYENMPEKYFEQESYDCFKVFYDAELENFADINIESDYDEKTVTIEPVLTFSYEDLQGSVADDGTWGTRSKFWLVRYVDLETGEMLDKPVVTVFTIKQDLDTPTLGQSVDKQGYYKLKWSEIEDADYYEIYGYDKSMDFAELEFTVEAGTTECNYEDFETAKWHESRFREKYKDTEIDVDEKWLMNEMLEEEGYGYFVVAKTNDGKVSGMSNECFVEDIASQIPVERSWDFQDEYEGDSPLALPAYVDVEMLDGSIGKFLIEYNGATVYLLEDGVISVWPTIKNLPIGMLSVELKGTDYEEFMANTVLLKEREEELEGKSGTTSENINIPYVPKNDDEMNNTENETDITQGETQDETTALGEETTDEDAKENEKENEYGTAGKNQNSKSAKDYGIDISEEFEKTIYANTAISEWTAYNLLAHNEEISYENFYESSDSEYLRDAFMEAYTQNPLCGIVNEVSYDYKTDTLYVEYVLSKDETVKMQEESLKKADEIVEDIIKEGMSDYEKEAAINAYLCENADYNEKIYDYINSDGTVSSDAVFDFANSFMPYGVLVDNVGVCESYAEAFLLLADKAGLNAVIVTGSMGGVDHEWNRCQIDGEWYTIDVTNNDCDYIPNCYFNISDDIARLIYKEDREALIDRYISEYTASDMKNEYYTKNHLYTEDTSEAVSMLGDLIRENDLAAIRMNINLKENEVDDIVKQVVSDAKLSSGKYYYSAGVISIVKK